MSLTLLLAVIKHNIDIRTVYNACVCGKCTRIHMFLTSMHVLLGPVHRMSDSSTEAFILRLYRQDNKVGQVVYSVTWWLRSACANGEAILVLRLDL